MILRSVLGSALLATLLFGAEANEQAGKMKPMSPRCGGSTTRPWRASWRADRPAGGHVDKAQERGIVPLPGAQEERGVFVEHLVEPVGEVDRGSGQGPRAHPAGQGHRDRPPVQGPVGEGSDDGAGGGQGQGQVDGDEWRQVAGGHRNGAEERHVFEEHDEGERRAQGRRAAPEREYEGADGQPDRLVENDVVEYERDGGRLARHYLGERLNRPHERRAQQDADEDEVRELGAGAGRPQLLGARRGHSGAG